MSGATNTQVVDALGNLQKEVGDLRSDMRVLSDEVGEVRGEIQLVKVEQHRFCEEQERSAQSHQKLHEEHVTLRRETDGITASLAMLGQNVDLTQKLSDNVHQTTNQQMRDLSSDFTAHRAEEIAFQRSIILAMVGIIVAMSGGFIGTIVTVLLKFKGLD